VAEAPRFEATWGAGLDRAASIRTNRINRAGKPPRDGDVEGRATLAVITNEEEMRRAIHEDRQSADGLFAEASLVGFEELDRLR
jgi:hypothetical protein